MRRRPRAPADPIVGSADLRTLALNSALISASGLLAQIYAGLRYGPTERARAVGFAGLVSGQLLYALRCRAKRSDGDRAAARRTNPHLGGALALSFGLLGAALFVPGLRRVFGGPIGALDLAVALGAGSLPLLAKAPGPPATQRQERSEEPRVG